MARAPEVRFLRECFTDPSVPGALVTGGAGVGKSRLVREALGRLDEDSSPSRARIAIATNAAASIPFGCLVDLIPDVSSTDPSDRFSFFQAVASSLAAEREDRRIALVVDDAHLLDAAGAALAFHLANVGAAFVCAVVRNGEPIPDAVLGLWKDAGASRLEVEPLPPEAATDLVERVLGAQVEQASMRALWEMAGGNVLFMRELVHGSLDRGELTQAEGVWRWTREVPVSVPLLELVQARIGSLGPAERRVLEILALGEPLGARLLEGLAGGAEVAAVERRGLIEVSREDLREEVRLAHPLYTEVVRSRVPAADAREIRRALATETEARGMRRPSDVLRVASWRLDADGSGDPGLLTDAAFRAARSFDPELGARLGAAAVAAGGGFRAALALGEALLMQNRFEEAEAALAPHQSSALQSELARHYLFQRTLALHWGLGRSDEADERLRAARPIRDDAAWRQQVDCLRAQVLAFHGPLDEAVRLAAPIVADEAADRWARLYGVSVVTTQLTFSGDTDRALEVLAPYIELAFELAEGFPSGPAWITAHQATALGYAGRLDEVESLLGGLLELATSVRDEQSRGGALMGLGIAALHRGDIRSARKSLREAVGPLQRSDLAGLLPWAYSGLARAEGEGGDGAAARAAARSAAKAISGRPRNRLYVYDRISGEAWAAAASGELSRARQIALDGAEELSELALQEVLLLVAALRLGAPRHEVASRLVEVCEGAEGVPLVFYGRYGAALASGEGDRIERAAGALEAIGHLLHAAETYAAASTAFGDEGRADSARRAAARAAALREERCPEARTPALSDLAGPDLTPRQREIAELAARGLANGEIAERLTVSVRTVEWHLQQVYGTLGAGGREELATLLGDRDG